MTKDELELLFRRLLWFDVPAKEDFEEFSTAILDLYRRAPQFRRHITLRFRQMADANIVASDTKVNLDSVRKLVAGEIGFAGWDELMAATDSGPLLFRYAVAAMERADFTALESAVGGPGEFDKQI